MRPKGVIRNPINMGLLLEFSTVFPDEQPLSVSEYLSGAGKDMILHVAASLLGFKNHNSKFNDNRELLKMFFSAANSQLANSVYEKIRAFGKVAMINPYSTLTIFEYFFTKEPDKKNQTDQEFEVNFFKAYLVVNSDYTNRQKKAFTTTETIERELKVPMKLFCMNYPVSDKHHYDIQEIWLTQLWKAIMLFQFLESNPKTQLLYQAFLTHFDVKDWQEYLKSFLPLTTSVMSNEKEGHTDFSVTEGANFEKSCSFLDKLILEPDEDLDEYDFLTIRSKPFYKVKDSSYRIIFNLFVVEKIYKGMYFLLKEVNEQLPEKQQVKALKSVIGNDFSEQVILYNVIKTIYANTKIQFTGQEIVNNKIRGGPDYYVRHYNNVLLFESKDFLIPKTAKMSFDFEEYQNEFEKKLYFEVIDGKEKHVGVMQLIAFIQVLLKNQFTLDNKYYYRDINIYPIIVVHDHQYNVPGFNHLINYWFEAELQELKEQGFFIGKVKPLIIINIDSLIDKFPDGHKFGDIDIAIVDGAASFKGVKEFNRIGLAGRPLGMSVGKQLA